MRALRHCSAENHFIQMKSSLPLSIDREFVIHLLQPLPRSILARVRVIPYTRTGHSCCIQFVGFSFPVLENNAASFEHPPLCPRPQDTKTGVCDVKFKSDTTGR